MQVLVVDDQAPFRAAARAVLSRIEEFALVGEAASGEEAVAMSESLEPDLILMDINMGEMNGIEAARRVTDAHPETMVILVSTYAAEDLPGRRPLQRCRGLRPQGRAEPPAAAIALGARRRSGLAATAEILTRRARHRVECGHHHHPNAGLHPPRMRPAGTA